MLDIRDSQSEVNVQILNISMSSLRIPSTLTSLNTRYLEVSRS